MVEEVSSPTVLALGINAVLQAAEAFGVRRRDLLARAKLSPEWLLHREDRLPAQCQHDIYRHAIAATGVEDLGLYVGRILYIDGLNLQLYMSTICDTFREYLNLVPSTLRSRGDLGRVLIATHGPFIRLEWHPLDPATGAERYLSDEMLAVSAAIVQSLCVQSIPVRAAQFTYPEPADCRHLREIFGTDLTFDAKVSCLIFDRCSLRYPMIKLSHELEEGMTDTLKGLFDDASATDQFLRSARQAIIRALPAGDSGVDRIAGELGVSRRTLQRRLTDRDTNFLQLLQDVRVELASRYLGDNRLAITEIGFLLGYSDQASFSSAFKSWYGQTPSDYRAAL